MKTVLTMALFNPMRSESTRRLISLAPLLAAAASGCDYPQTSEGQPTRTTEVAVLEIALPQQVGNDQVPLRRPAVEFDHALHTDKLAEQGCETCHPKKTTELTPAATQPLAFQIGATQGTADRDQLMDFYHELCVGCHRERAAQGKPTGAVACGDCHTAQPPASSARIEMAFDYSLHHRHSEAESEECGHCHHTERDAQSGELVGASGKEESCRGCHGTTEQEGRSPLRAAVHQDCVNCHVERRAKQAKAGPVDCAGCHDAEARGRIARVDDAPVPDVGQPTETWIHAEGAGSNLVPFDHAAHQPRADSCSSCHHQRLTACDECHTVSGSAEGGMVTLADAYHRKSASFSCVGCHDRATHTKDCAGCHESMGPAPADSSCVRCHSGPPASAGPPGTDAKLPPVEFQPLPEESVDFPTTVVIDSLAEHYTPSTFPHRQIVVALDKIARQSALATRFHGTTETLCAGCHHESPVGTRPPSCGSCHGKSAHPTRDMPSLKGALHRQCIGCHQQMAIEPQGCSEGCHQEATKEAKP